MHDHRFTLQSFDPVFAPLVASWVTTPQALFKLAPSCKGPLTAEKVVDWTRCRGGGYLLFADNASVPCGYGEVNSVRSDPEQYWLGHLLVDPGLRGRGIGTELTRQLMDRAATSLGARKIVLVVFPDNVEAIRCYRKCGFQECGQETHRFGPSAHPHRMLRMETYTDHTRGKHSTRSRKIRVTAG